MNKHGHRILVVDENVHIRRLLRRYLANEGYSIDEAENGEKALQKTVLYHFDLIILDIMLPGIDGIELCSRLRRKKSTPVLILTAKADEANRLQGFDVGADDYVVKPFSPREVMLRIKAILQRTSPMMFQIQDTNDKKNKIVLPDLVIDDNAHSVTVGGVKISLAPKEYDLLHYLASSPERVFTRETLLKDVWKLDYFGDLRTVDTHIKRLRMKMKPFTAKVSAMITTVRGIGYKLEVHE